MNLYAKQQFDSEPNGAWHHVIVHISLLSSTCIYGNHVCNMFHHWDILMATTQMFHYRHFHPSLHCCHSYNHNGQQADLHNDVMPCPTLAHERSCLIIIWIGLCSFISELMQYVICFPLPLPLSMCDPLQCACTDWGPLLKWYNAVVFLSLMNVNNLLW